MILHRLKSPTVQFQDGTTIGSVKHGIEIEKKYKDTLPELSLSDAIGAESPFKPTGVAKFLADRLVRHGKYKEDGKLHSDGKMEFFYKLVMLALFLIFVLLTFSGGISSQKSENDEQQPIAAENTADDTQTLVDTNGDPVDAVLGHPHSNNSPRPNPKRGA